MLGDQPLIDRHVGALGLDGLGRPARAGIEVAQVVVDVRQAAPVAVCDCGLLGNGGVMLAAALMTWQIGSAGDRVHTAGIPLLLVSLPMIV